MPNFVEQMSLHENNIEPKLKRARQCKNENESETKMEGNEDRLSDLPDSLVLHILSFVKCKTAVQTCILSRRWKDLWKQLPSLVFHSHDFRTVKIYNKFVPKVLSLRDGSLALHTLDFQRYGLTEPRLLERVLSYAISHDVQQLGISVECDIAQLPSCIFSCQTLTSLKLYVYARRLPEGRTALPKSLNFPALKSLHLRHFLFHASDSDRAEPFSRCNSLDNLVVESCSLRDAKVLCISSATLSSLALNPGYYDSYDIVLSTPNLRCFAFKGSPLHHLSGSSLSSVEQVDIDAEILSRDYSKSPSILLDWLIGLTNVQSLKVCTNMLQVTYFGIF